MINSECWNLTAIPAIGVFGDSSVFPILGECFVFVFVFVFEFIFGDSSAFPILGECSTFLMHLINDSRPQHRISDQGYVIRDPIWI